MKSANLIVVGGPISVGKSTLVESLDFPQVSELNDNDRLQNIMLEGTYTKRRISPAVIEFYFLIERVRKYRKFSCTLTAHVLDRSIFESLWFAQGNLSKADYDFFYKLWESEIVKLIKEYGKPKLYILLTMKWDTFKERIFSRGRDVEVKNFTDNVDFFKKHVREYEEHMIGVFMKFDINFIKLSTDGISIDAVLEKAQQEIKEVINGENC